MVDVGTGGKREVIKFAPIGLLEPKSLRTILARRIAPSIFNCPAHCTKLLQSVNAGAEYIKRDLSMLGVRVELAWNISAAAPAVAGAAIDEPLRYIMPRFSASLTRESSCG